MKYILNIVIGIAAFIYVTASHPAVVTSLSSATPLPIPAISPFISTNFGQIAPGISFSSTHHAVFGSVSMYSFDFNGCWCGVPNSTMIGLNSNEGFFDINFETPISGFIGEINWSYTMGRIASVQAYNSNDELLDSITLNALGSTVIGSNLVNPGFYGFAREQGDISFVRFEQAFIAVRNIGIIESEHSVPEPGSLSLLLVAVAAALRKAVGYRGTAASSAA